MMASLLTVDLTAAVFRQQAGLAVGGPQLPP